MEIQPLWAAARGQAPAQRGSLQAALRGLHLAAAQPAPAAIGDHTHLSSSDSTAMLHGTFLPPWEAVEELVTALHAEVTPLRPLWDAARAAAAGPPPPPHASAPPSRLLAEAFG